MPKSRKRSDFQPSKKVVMNPVKRVRFAKSIADDILNSRTDAPSVGYKTSQPHSFDAPKTSEYAFFKKLKKNGGSCHSYPQHKGNIQMKCMKPSDCTREISNDFNEDHGSALLAEKTRILDQEPLPSYVGNRTTKLVLHKADTADKANFTLKDFTSPSFAQDLTPINRNLCLSPLDSASNAPGNQHAATGVFSTKRRRLRQRVADISWPEVDKHCCDGIDLVSMLLSRLFHEDNEYTCDMDLKQRRVDIDTKSPLPIVMDIDTESPLPIVTESDYLVKTHTRDVWEYEYGSFFRDDDSPKHMPDMSKEIFLSKWEDLCSDSPSTSHDLKTHSQYKKWNYSCDTDYYRRFTSLFADNYPYFRLPYGEETPVESSHLLEMDEFRDRFTLGRREPCTLLLGWNFSDEKDEHDSHDMNLSENCQQGLNHSLFSSSSCYNLLSNDTSYSYMDSDRLEACGFQKNGENGMNVEPKQGQFPLTISYTPNCHKLLEDHNSIFISPLDHHPSLEPFFLPKGLEIDSEWKSLSIADSFARHHSSSSDDFQFPQMDLSKIGETLELDRPLLFNDSAWAGYNEICYYNDDDDDYVDEQ